MGNNKEQIEKLGKAYIYPNAVIVKRENKRTIITENSNTPAGCFLELRMLEKDKEMLKLSASNEEIINGNIREITVGLTNESLMSIWLAAGHYLTQRGVIEAIINTKEDE
jgi:hypothetical protein